MSDAAFILGIFTLAGLLVLVAAAEAEYKAWRIRRIVRRRVAGRMGDK